MSRLSGFTVCLVALALIAAPACGGGNASAGTPGEGIKKMEVDVPEQILHLEVDGEDVTENLAGVERSYVDGMALYSLREDDLVKATLQVGRFNDDAEYRTSNFRRAIVNQIGGVRPQTVRLDEETVYLTKGTKQQIAVWFRDRYLFVLAVRDDYAYPRSLIREALEIEV